MTDAEVLELRNGQLQAIIADARRRARSRRLRIGLGVGLALATLAALSPPLGGPGGRAPVLASASSMGIATANAPGQPLLTSEYLKATWDGGSYGRWAAMVQLADHQIDFSCDVTDAQARRYASAIRRPFSASLLARLEADCRRSP